MSNRVSDQCWSLSPLPSSTKFVLMSLADHANQNGHCWPSISRICTRTCLGRTTVIESLKWLEANGVLKIERKPPRSNRYVLTPELFVIPNPQSETRTIQNPDGPRYETQQSALQTLVVRQADPNRKEPSRSREQKQQGARGTRLSENWTPKDELKNWAANEHPHVDFAATLAEFRDFWIAVPGVRGRKLDWEATFRNRIRQVDSRSSSARVRSSKTNSITQDFGGIVY